VLVRDGQQTALSAKARLDVKKGDVLRIESPGGGGWG
jgi:N-methylhydantoinase B/oxoprolinase/acetone carboxylase alpha subunit